MQYTLADMESIKLNEKYDFFFTLNPCLDMNMSPIMKLIILMFRIGW